MCFFRRRSDAWKRFEMERRYYLRFSRWAIRRKALELHHGFSGFPTEVEKNPEDHSDPLWVFPSISFGTTIKLEEVVIFFVKPNVKGDLLSQRSSSSRFLVPDGVGWFLNVSGPPPSHTISCHTLSYIMSFWYVTPIYIYILYTNIIQSYHLIQLYSVSSIGLPANLLLIIRQVYWYTDWPSYFTFTKGGGEDFKAIRLVFNVLKQVEQKSPLVTNPLPNF